MANKEIERKIAVIFATDVVGYSKSVEVNEEQTIKNFRSFKKILEDLFKEHDGRIFNPSSFFSYEEPPLILHSQTHCK